MNEGRLQGAEESRRASDPTAALLVAGGTVLSLALMAHHPTTGAKDLAGAVDELAREAVLSGTVHGSLLVMMTLVFVGLLGLVARLGWRHHRSVAGTVFYSLGMVCMVGAALVNGFVVEGLASRYAGSPEAELEHLRPVLRLCFQANHTLAAAGTIAISLAILCWSSLLLGAGNAGRWIGLLGLVAGALPVLGLLSGHLHLDVHGMGAVLLAQGLWNLAVAARLLRPPVVR